MRYETYDVSEYIYEISAYLRVTLTPPETSGRLATEHPLSAFPAPVSRSPLLSLPGKGTHSYSSGDHASSGETIGRPPSIFELSPSKTG